MPLRMKLLILSCYTASAAISGMVVWFIAQVIA